MIDYSGECFIIDVNTDNCTLELNVGKYWGNLVSQCYYVFQQSGSYSCDKIIAILIFILLNNQWLDHFGRCRWSSNSGEPLLFVKYDNNQLNVLDVEKKALTLKTPHQIDLLSKFRPSPFQAQLILLLIIDDIYWIDICPNNGNLLAAGDSNGRIKIVDKREAKIVKIFEDIHLDETHCSADNGIDCVRWSPNGDMLASASRDTTTKLVEFTTEKVLYSGITSDERKS